MARRPRAHGPSHGAANLDERGEHRVELWVGLHARLRGAGGGLGDVHGGMVGPCAGPVVLSGRVSGARMGHACAHFRSGAVDQYGVSEFRHHDPLGPAANCVHLFHFGAFGAARDRAAGREPDLVAVFVRDLLRDGRICLCRRGVGGQSLWRGQPRPRAPRHADDQLLGIDHRDTLGGHFCDHGAVGD